MFIKASENARCKKIELVKDFLQCIIANFTVISTRNECMILSIENQGGSGHWYVVTLIPKVL